MERQARKLPARAAQLRVPIGCLLTLLLLAGCEPPHPEARIGQRDDVAVHVSRVGLDVGASPVVILKEDDGERWLPIWIGSAEARSIAWVMSDRRAPRPNTHDLTRNVIEGLDAEVLRVVVTELRSSTYYAELTLRVRGEVISIDSRPSDAIAVALRANAPIFVREVLFDDRESEISPSQEPGAARLQI